MNKFFIYLTFLSVSTLFSQENGNDIRIMFYNTENLFDPQIDSINQDKEFTPEGSRYWTKRKYISKLNAVFKVIVAAGSWYPPEIIGLCEVENHKVISDLINNTPLCKYEYKIIHYDSPDKRGIDVAVLYNSKKIYVKDTHKIPVIDPNNSNFSTRDILHVTFCTKQNDTIHIFINHWPSRRGGKEQSEAKRILSSNILHDYIDSTLTKNSNIIIMGDFNDTPEDESILSLLTGYKNDLSIINQSHCKGINCGTLKFKGKWYLFDQILVSSGLTENNKLFVIQDSFHISVDNFLLTDDKSFSGNKSFSTYNGYRYQGGFSDHLPVSIIISRN